LGRRGPETKEEQFLKGEKEASGSPKKRGKMQNGQAGKGRKERTIPRVRETGGVSHKAMRTTTLGSLRPTKARGKKKFGTNNLIVKGKWRRKIGGHSEGKEGKKGSKVREGKMQEEGGSKGHRPGRNQDRKKPYWGWKKKTITMPATGEITFEIPGDTAKGEKTDGHRVWG